MREDKEKEVTIIGVEEIDEGVSKTMIHTQRRIYLRKIRMFIREVVKTAHKIWFKVV